MLWCSAESTESGLSKCQRCGLSRASVRCEEPGFGGGQDQPSCFQAEDKRFQLRSISLQRCPPRTEFRWLFTVAGERTLAMFCFLRMENKRDLFIFYHNALESVCRNKVEREIKSLRKEMQEIWISGTVALSMFLSVHATCQPARSAATPTLPRSANPRQTPLSTCLKA